MNEEEIFGRKSLDCHLPFIIHHPSSIHLLSIHLSTHPSTHLLAVEFSKAGTILYSFCYFKASEHVT